ncbi:hypothetical protein [Photorhabdus stackebrandtii]|uniref:Uncharacterized protein n=1 Tax=Photorhabdus stackebrandtii TaxID=1123042 RepID=A0A7X5QN80_9GAMM|nr:hypothetical protein [Photorhabdus stackebrandtii]NHB97416.1 hypothetical protein [Photorhabdus stackebrandtii]
MEYQKIGQMSLKNSGGFVARIQFSYIDANGEKFLSKQSDDITLGVTKTIDPGDLGVPDGATVYMHVFVVWGRDNEAHQVFLYEKGSQAIANYMISGTTLNNDLGLIDVIQ